MCVVLFPPILLRGSTFDYPVLIAFHAFYFDPRLQDYSPSLAEPSSLNTSDIVATVSDTVVKAVGARSPTVMEADDDSSEADDGDDDFFTASEGDEESDDGRSKDGFRSSTKVALDFSLAEVCSHVRHPVVIYD